MTRKSENFLREHDSVTLDIPSRTRRGEKEYISLGKYSLVKIITKKLFQFVFDQVAAILGSDSKGAISSSLPILYPPSFLASKPKS